MNSYDDVIIILCSEEFDKQKSNTDWYGTFSNISLVTPTTPYIE